MFRRQTLSLLALPVAGCVEPVSTEPIYRITAQERTLPENGSVSQVSPVPSPVQSAIDEAARPENTDGEEGSISREEFDAALEPFCECDPAAITPEERIYERSYYVRHMEQVYRIEFRILGEG